MAAEPGCVKNSKVAHLRKEFPGEVVRPGEIPNGPCNLKDVLEGYPSVGPDGKVTRTPLDPNGVYCGRAGIVFVPKEDGEGKERYPKQASPFANPFKVGAKHHTLEESLRLYEDSLDRVLAKHPTALESLRGKNLYCWCRTPSSPSIPVCHCDIILAKLHEMA